MYGQPQDDLECCCMYGQPQDGSIRIVFSGTDTLSLCCVCHCYHTRPHQSHVGTISWGNPVCARYVIRIGLLHLGMSEL